MKNSTQGPVLETFGPEIRITAMIAVVAAIVCLLAFGVARELKNDVTAWVIFAGLILLFAGVLLMQSGYRVEVHETGLSWRGIFAEGEIRWGDIQEIYFGSYQIRGPYRIPLGTYYLLKLVNVHGTKISFNQRVRGADVLVVWIQQRTRDAMFAKVKGLFESGAEVDFGAVRVSRAEGVTVKRWYATKTLRWDEISECEFGNGVRFRTANWGSGCKVPGERLANAHILQGLLSGAIQVK